MAVDHTYEITRCMRGGMVGYAWSPVYVLCVRRVLARVCWVSALSLFCPLSRSLTALQCYASPVCFHCYTVSHRIMQYIFRLSFRDFPRLVGRYCSYLLPKQVRELSKHNMAKSHAR